MGNACGGCGGGPSASSPTQNRVSRQKTKRLQNWQRTGIVALRDAKLREVPDTAREVAGAARVLDVTRNRLLALPDFLPAFPNLQRLLAAHNQIARLPPGLASLAGLRILVLDHNCLAALPDDLPPSLEKLSCSHNALTALPAGLGRLRRLAQLDASHNRLAALPDALGECGALEVGGG